MALRSSSRYCHPVGRLLLIVIAVFLWSLAPPFEPVPAQASDHAEDPWVEQTLSSMTLEEKVGQLFLVRAYMEFVNLESEQYGRLRDLVHRYHVGGFALTVRAEGPLLDRARPYEAAMLTNLLQQESRLPLLFAADFENGLGMRMQDVTLFPQAMAFGAAGDPANAARLAEITAREARAIGVHWNFGPVADVNSNPENPIINTRSFGEDPQLVARFVEAYVVAARSHGLMTTAKHFPGHGDTDRDPHLSIARVPAHRSELEAVDLPAFRTAIAAGVDAVMTAHVTVPALDPERPASLSPRVIHDLLQEKLGFDGLVVTDAMDMPAFTSLFGAGQLGASRAAVEALRAGNDVLLIPGDLDAAYHGVLEAVRNGEISQERLDRSVRKLLRAKASLGLPRRRLVDVEALSREVAQPANVAFGQQVAEQALTLVRDNRVLLPLHTTSRGTSPAPAAYQTTGKSARRLVAVLLLDSVRGEAGRVFARELRRRVPAAEIFFVDAENARALARPILHMLDEADEVVVALQVSPRAGRRVLLDGKWKGSAGLPPDAAWLLKEMLWAATIKTAVVALGSPYIAEQFPLIENYLCTYSDSPVSERGAVRALFGEIQPRGRLPVTIPRVATLGDGIQPHRVMSAVSATGP